MRRRAFIAGLASVAVWPFSARAQRPTTPLIGYLSPGLPGEVRVSLAAFRPGLGEMGYAEGRNVTIEVREAQSDLSQLPELVADLVRRQAAVLVTSGTPAAIAAKAATTSIPIVFGLGSNPVQFGLVASLNRPGGNVTGVIDMDVELVSKRLGLLQELVPHAERFAALVNPASQIAETVNKNVQTAAAAIGRPVEIFNAASSGEIDMAFAAMVQKRSDAILVGPDPLFAFRRVQLISLAARHATPTIYPSPARLFAEAGGLINYGSNNAERMRQIGIYTGRILKGERPADLPVMRPAKFEFIINLQTAKLLGMTVPATLLATADEVIE
jgi:putative tryptophan/tyrosine transport system substrate-binding protein